MADENVSVLIFYGNAGSSISKRQSSGQMKNNVACGIHDTVGTFGDCEAWTIKLDPKLRKAHEDYPSNGGNLN